MYRFFYIVFLLVIVSLSLAAQESKIPKRTAVDIARKQTEMLVRELNIHDSIMRDTLFKVHLKYAKQQYRVTTRAEVRQTMKLLFEELKHILSPEQYERFINRQTDGQPRAPKHPCNWIAPPHRQHNNGNLAHPIAEELDTLPLQQEHLSTIPQ